MTDHLPIYIPLLMAACVVYACVVLYKASQSKSALVITLLWLALQGGISLTGLYTKSRQVPPPFILLVLPPLLLIIILFMTKSGKTFINRLDQRWLTALHIVRIPVELVLFLLYHHGLVPKLITFEGQNFDIISGISAIGILYLGYHRNSLKRGLIIAWHVLCLLLLFNVVFHAVLSVPTPFQQFAFDAPNTGVLYFPFTWLPGFIVPLVLFSHLVCLKQFSIDFARQRQAI